MKRNRLEYLFALAAFLLLIVSHMCGCGSALNSAIAASNGLGDVLDATAPIVEERCTRGYQRIADSGKELDARKLDVAKLDEVCLPRGAAYDSARSTHVLVIAAILTAQAASGSRVEPASMLALAVQAVNAGEALARSVEAITKGKAKP